MPLQLPFPTPFGARDNRGRVCVGAAKSRSKHCITRLEFYDPTNKSTTFVLATDVDWMPKDGKTIAVLLDTLRDVLHEKVEVKFDRGMVTGRLIGSRFYLLEIAKGMVWPRYKWWMPYRFSGWHEVVPLLIRYETIHPETLVAEPDNRPPSLDLERDPTESGYAPVHMEGSHREWLDELLKLRSAATGRAPQGGC